MYKICLVEDEINLSNLVKTYLEKESYEVTVFNNGEEAIQNINNNYDLWILDIMLKDEISGYEVIKKIREVNQKTPIIFTSARDKDIDRILGLEMGSDDYLVKPYSIKELVLRINRILNRVYHKDTNKEVYETYTISKEYRNVIESEIDLKLTTKEFDLLLLFINNKNKVFTRENIISSIFEENYYGSDRTIDDLVRRIRKKMPKLRIETIYGYGYKLL